jgi:hypothetical protein
MNVKIALLTLLVILAATAIFAATAAAFNEAPSTTSIYTNLDEENSDYLTLSSEVQPVGKDRGGGWPLSDEWL